MIIKNASINNIQRAIEKINKKYDNNIQSKSAIYQSYSKLLGEWRRGELTIWTGQSGYKMSLLIIEFDKKGARIGLINKSNRLACFHVHYDFFNTLLEINPNVIICLYDDWIIKKTVTGKVTGNLDKINSDYYIHKPNPSSFMCKCK